MKTTTRRHLALLLGISLFLGLLLLADPAKVMASLRRVKVAYLGLATLVYAASWLLRTGRLLAMGRALDCGKLEVFASFKAYIAAFAINSVLPMKMGDAAMVGFLKLAGVEASRGAAIVIKGRILDLVTIVALLIPPLVLYQGEREIVTPVMHAAAVTLSLVGVFLLVVFLSKTTAIRGVLHWLVERYKGGKVELLCNTVESTSGHLIEMMQNPSLMVLCLLLSFGAWICEGVVLWVVLLSLGVEAALLPVLAATMIANLGKGVPGTPGGVGVYEGIVAGFLVTFGVALELGLTAAIIDHMTKKAVNLGIGIPAATSMGYNFQRRRV